jgi:hypothetical protein
VVSGSVGVLRGCVAQALMGASGVPSFNCPPVRFSLQNRDELYCHHPPTIPSSTILPRKKGPFLCARLLMMDALTKVVSRR